MKSGFTLIEAMVALAIVAIVATLALPSFGSALERARLKSAAETLAADLGEARFESARRGAPLHVQTSAGAGWCWVVATTDGCPCDGVAPCRLKATHARDHLGVEIVEPLAARFDPGGGVVAPASTVFQSAHGERLRVDLLALGRARVCAPLGAVPGYPGC